VAGRMRIVYNMNPSNSAHQSGFGGSSNTSSPMNKLILHNSALKVST